MSNSSSSSNKEVVRVWVREQAQRLNQEYFSTELQGATHPALSVLNRLIAAIQQLEQDVCKEGTYCLLLLLLYEFSLLICYIDFEIYVFYRNSWRSICKSQEIQLNFIYAQISSSFKLVCRSEKFSIGFALYLCLYIFQPNCAVIALREISRIVTDSDISPFEVIHSGLVCCLLSYLTASENSTMSLTQDGSLMAAIGGTGNSTENGSLTSVSISTPRDTRLRNFLHVFLGCPVGITMEFLCM